ncbi:MAG: DUF4388 domain-containing protein [bacterium]
MNEIPSKGALRDYSIAKLLIYINRNRLTGTLIVKTPRFTKKVFLVKGDAIFASSTNEDDRLGEMLIKAGKITVEQYEKSVELLKKTKKRQGVILVELGFLAPKDLYWGVKYQVREIICSIFLLEDGEYEFVKENVSSDEVITLKMSMGNLIYEGIRRIDNWTKIRVEMPGMNEVLMLSNDPFSLFQNIELSQQDKKILSLIDGRKTIKEIIDSSWIGSFEALKILYVLFSIGLIVKSDEIGAKTAGVSVDDLLSELSDEGRPFARKVDEYLQKIATANYFEILETDHDADGQIIKKNYYRLVKEFHPDKHYDSEDTALKDKLTTIVDRVSLAYAHLNSPEKIEEYKKSLSKAAKGTSERGTGQQDEVVLAKQHYELGVNEFKKKNYKGAVEKFKQATALDTRNAKYWSYLSLSLSKLPDRTKDADEALLQAIKLEPDNADYLVNLGLLYMKGGLHQRAKTQFEKALTLEPDNEKAMKGLKEVKAVMKK